MTTYQTIYADPPWPYEDRKGPTGLRKEPWKHVGVEANYDTLPIAKIKALPVTNHVADNAHLYLWATNSFLVEAHEIARAWGFTPKTVLTWAKVKKTDGTPSMKTGYYYRGASEHLLFAVRGRLRLAGPCRPTIYLLPREAHSVKPDRFYDLIEEQSPGPYLELFARRPRPGWSQWGNQIESTFQLQ